MARCWHVPTRSFTYFGGLAACGGFWAPFWLRFPADFVMRSMILLRASGIVSSGNAMTCVPSCRPLCVNDLTRDFHLWCAVKFHRWKTPGASHDHTQEKSGRNKLFIVESGGFS